METDLKTLVDFIDSIKASHPIRVGIDGVTASGKSTLSKKLKSLLEQAGRKVILVGLDHFHNLRQIRYKDGRSSPSGYFRNAYNVEGIIENVLKPLIEKDDFKYKEKIHDVESDQVLDLPWKKVDPEAIVIVEGSFSLRRELRSYFECKIYLDVEFQISENRGAIRDTALFGTEQEARKLIKERYHKAHKIYLQENQPSKNCDFIIRNNEHNNPEIRRVTPK